MKIAIDVMGGDNSPGSNIDGAFDYLKESNDLNTYFYLVGNETIIKEYLKKHNQNSQYISIVNADEVISKEDTPSRIFKTKPNCSIVKCIKMLKDKKIDAVISAGDTGALLATSLFLVGKIKSIKRPALAPYVPSENKGFLLCDAGANVDTKPEHLVQFAIMSKCYLEYIENIKNPKIGLLNIGKEPNKGNDLVKQVYPLLKSKFKELFIGNIEPRYILNSDVDIIVCDGFSGNIVLKLTEGIFKNIYNWIAKDINFDNNIKKNIESTFDYEEHGGTPLLGIKGIVIKCHGSSTKKSIFHSLKNAKLLYEKQLVKIIENSLVDEIEV